MRKCSQSVSRSTNNLLKKKKNGLVVCLEEGGKKIHCAAEWHQTLIWFVLIIRVCGGGIQVSSLSAVTLCQSHRGAKMQTK